MTERIPLVAVLGPTAVGKTRIAIRLAEALNGEIVSADSRLLYRGMDIGTAKPTREQRARVPHHLVDVADPREPWSLATFQAAALTAIREVHSKGCLAFLVGGTGQYIRGLLEGWVPPPGSSNSVLRRKLESLAKIEGPEALHRRLQDLDPETAARIDYRNVRRVVRALEIHQLTGQPPSRVRRREPPALQAIQIGLSLPRRQLYAQIDARVASMLEEGLVDEVRKLLEDGVSPGLPAMSAIGYRQIVQHLQGDLSLEEAIKEMRRSTRQLVRRQANWFKPDDPGIHWFKVRPEIEAEIVPRIREWLSGSWDGN